MKSHTSHTFLSFKAIACLSITAASALVFAPKFVHADEVPAQTTATVSASTPAEAIRLVAGEQSPPTPASTIYYDGINVAVIAVAAYDR